MAQHQLRARCLACHTCLRDRSRRRSHVQSFHKLEAFDMTNVYLTITTAAATFMVCKCCAHRDARVARGATMAARGDGAGYASVELTTASSFQNEEDVHEVAKELGVANLRFGVSSAPHRPSSVARRHSLFGPGNLGYPMVHQTSSVIYTPHYDEHDIHLGTIGRMFHKVPTLEQSMFVCPLSHCVSVFHAICASLGGIVAWFARLARRACCRAVCYLTSTRC